MPVAVRMPDLGTPPGDVLVVGCWLAEADEEVWEGQDLVEIVCREATFDVPCPTDGVLTEILVFADEPVRPGQVLAIIEPRGELDQPSDTDNTP